MREFRIDNISNVSFFLDEMQVLLLVPLRCESLSDSDYEDVKDRLCAKGYDFLYLPKLMQSIPQELVDYYVPEQNGKSLLSYDVVQNRILGELGFSLTAPMAIIRDDEEIIGLQTEEGDEDTEEFVRQLLEHLCGDDFFDDDDECPIMAAPCFEKEDVCCDMASPCDALPCGPPPSPFVYKDAAGEEYHLEELIEELKEVNEEKLTALGLSEKTLRFILGYTKPKLSRLRVTRHSKIILDDYSEREIKMDDKTKALYLLYLRHPEGIAIKDLNDYSNELMDLYQSISGRDDPAAMKQTISNLVDPFQNNANISLSRIKKAFCEALAMQIASNYYVEGERGGARAIALDRNLVTWETIR